MPRQEEAHQHLLIALVQLHPVIIHPRRPHHLIQFRNILPHRLAVIPRDQRRIGQHRVPSLHVHESRRPVEIKIQFLLIQQMKRRHVMLPEAQVLERRFQLRRRHKKIREHHHQRPLPDLLRRLVQRGQQRRPAQRLQIPQPVQHQPQVRRPRAAPGFPPASSARLQSPTASPCSAAKYPSAPASFRA